MKLLLVRHGEAEEPNQEVQDKDRKLVKKGIKQMRRVGSFLSEVNFLPERVISSPFIRAYQSADVILDEMELEMQIETEDFLLPSSDPTTVMQALVQLDGNVMVVGHNPLLENVIKALTGGEVSLKKGGIALVEVEKEKGVGTLELLLDQKTLKLL
ncbi:phosphohistidine phosphatase SixA [Sulfuracidifex tepidarius]|nr:phosphohistidine phosphatase SixA [Sulfuracidifex tepidarius]